MNNVKKFEIKIDGEKWTKALDKAFNTKKKDLKVDGFRKGNCPKDIYLKKFGIESLFMDGTDYVLEDAYNQAKEENHFEPVCEPKVDIKTISADEVVFVFTIIERPEVKLGQYTNLGVKKEEVKVSKAEVDEKIKSLQENYADVIEVSEGVLEEGNTAVINFVGEVDGEVLEGGSGDNYPLEIGSNTFIPGFEEGLIGMTIGEERTLNLKFPEDYVDSLKNKDVKFTVILQGIKKRILPELNEEFYKDLGYEDVADEKTFREKIKEHLLEHKQSDADNKYTDAVLDKAISNMSIEINQEIIDDEVDSMLHNISNNLKMQGVSMEMFLSFNKCNINEFKEKLTPDAIKRIKTSYLLLEIIDKENIDITDEEVEKAIDEMAQNYEVSTDEIIENIGGKDVIAYDLKMQKALNFLREN
jgi:trigger factor